MPEIVRRALRLGRRDRIRHAIRPDGEVVSTRATRDEAADPALGRKDPAGFVKKNAAKRLAAIAKLVFEAIPQDPTRAKYRQASTLGDEHRRWFRARLFQQYRPFFRCHAKVIVYAWVDEDAKRA